MSTDLSQGSGEQLRLAPFSLVAMPRERSRKNDKRSRSMSLRYDDYQKVLRNEHFHRQIQSTMMAGQTALLMDMSGTLNHLNAEMDAIRRLNLEGLAVQQEMLQREQLQGQLEEFIYKTEKMVESFSDAGCELPPSARYFSLRGVKETVEQVGLGTALIRGRDNKAAFESAMEQVHALLGQLKTHPEVTEALDWVKAEQKRLTEQKAQEQEEQRRIAAENAEHQARLATERDAILCPLLQELSRLKAQRKSLDFFDWYKQAFGTLPVLAQIPMWWPGMGIFWIPAWYFMTKAKAEQAMNSAIDAEIATVEQKLQGIR